MANHMERSMESTSSDLRFTGTTMKKQINKNTKNEATAWGLLQGLPQGVVRRFSMYFCFMQGHPYFNR